MSFDPELERKALALLASALEQPIGSRQEYIEQQTQDPMLRARALELLAFDEHDDSILTGGGVQTIEDTPAPDKIGPYKLTKKIGEGGMGVVYLGERIDDQFSQKVAIKLAKGYLVTERLKDRLKHERQTLARLNHPHIAQLYDGGQLENQTPYFIMEYVEGKGLLEYLTSQQPGLDERLDLFTDILEAVAHAHSNLIIHRDLSPANTLVTDDGTVKLIDFGISHTLLGRTAPSTTISRTVTKGYAAPEQIRGEATTTLSDIYSLGILLGDLVNGLDLDRAADMKAIINKASASNPKQRYSTVEALIDDVKRYRQKYSVAANDTGAFYKFKRFLGRHPLSMGASAIAVTGLFAAIAIISSLYFDVKQAEAEASQRFDEVRTLAGTVLYSVYDAISDLPGSTGARRVVVDAAQDYLGKLAQDEHASPDLILEAATGLTELGKIMGSPARSSFEDIEAAQGFYEDAASLLARLETSQPRAIDTLYALADLHYAKGELVINSDKEAARPEFQAAQTYLQEALAQAPEDPALKLPLLSTQLALADISYRSDAHEEAQTAVRDVIQTTETDMTLPNEKAEKHLLLNRAYRLLGVSIVNDMETRPEAIAPYTSAAENIDAAFSLLPRSQYIRIERAKTYRELGFAYYMNESHEQARLHYQTAIDILSNVTETDPDDKTSALLLIYYKGEITAPLSSLSRFDEAEAVLLDVLDTYETRLAEEPENGARMRNLFVHHYFLGSHYRLREMTEKSCFHIYEMGRYVEVMRNAGVLQELDDQNYNGIIKQEYEQCF